MIVRIGRVTAVAAAGFVAVLGLVVLPVAVLTTWVVMTVIVGPLIAVGLHSAHPAPRANLRFYATVTTALMVVSAVTVGLAVVMGAAAALLPLLLAVIGAGLWWRRRDVLQRLLTLRRRTQQHPVNAAAVEPRPVRGFERTAPRVPHIEAEHLPTPVLCAIWRRTYWLLQELPPAGPERVGVVELRARLLDELDRRDPRGLDRWLQTEPRAGSSPDRYLITDH